MKLTLIFTDSYCGVYVSTNTRSILRYPGSKARFANFIAACVRLNGIRNSLFVEPFCGGCSVSIALLEDGVVERIALNDADPLIAALWDTVFSPTHAEWLADVVMEIPLTLDEWKRQKNLRPNNSREAALKCFYLNRTSFNGIIHKAGPLGGWKQDKHTLGVRFNRHRLATRIRELSQYSDRVKIVASEDWKTFCNKMKKFKNSLFYLDPPFFHKADALYGHYFNLDEHYCLSKYVAKLGAKWMLSYDDVHEIRTLYEEDDYNARIIDSTYSTHPIGGASFVGRELFYTNLTRLPSPDKGGVLHSGLTIRRKLVLPLNVNKPIRMPCLLEDTELIAA